LEILKKVYSLALIFLGKSRILHHPRGSFSSYLGWLSLKRVDRPATITIAGVERTKKAKGRKVSLSPKA